MASASEKDCKELNLKNFKIYRLVFDVYLKENDNQNQDSAEKRKRNETPRLYQMRGALLNWLNKQNPEIASNLHLTDQKGNNKVYRQYSIQMDKIFENSTRDSFFQNDSIQDLLKNLENENHNSSNRPYGRRFTSRNRGRLIGYKFYIHILDEGIVNAVYQHILHMNENLIVLGQTQYTIAEIKISSCDIYDLLKTVKPLRKVGLKFLTPTAFKPLNSEQLLRIPDPKFVLGNLVHQWHRLFENTELDTPEELRYWIEENVAMDKINIKNSVWEMGKKHAKFRGFMGSVVYRINKDETIGADNSNSEISPDKVDNSHFQALSYNEWMDLLLNFGLLTNVGKSRTAGFGRISILYKDFHN